jgi:hypothetical protein
MCTHLTVIQEADIFATGSSQGLDSTNGVTCPAWLAPAWLAAINLTLVTIQRKLSGSKLMEHYPCLGQLLNPFREQ